MERNILLTIQYDGTAYSGWQRQPNAVTVQGELERALKKICGGPVELQGTSRTDAGVHALGQRASFKGEFSIPTENIRRALNGILPPDIAIARVEEKPLEFHARFDAVGKTYRYQIDDSGVKDPFTDRYHYVVRRGLDEDLMRKAAEGIIGTHDFAAFQATGGQPRETTVRTITGLEVWREGHAVIFEVTGDGFLYHMVRIIAGTLVEAGQGKIPPEEIPAIVGSCDRERAGHTAPAHGLFLKQIYYNEDI